MTKRSIYLCGILIIVIVIVAALIMEGCGKNTTMEQMESKYGKLTRYVPDDGAFVYFHDSTNTVSILTIEQKNMPDKGTTYQVLSKSKK